MEEIAFTFKDLISLLTLLFAIGSAGYGLFKHNAARIEKERDLAFKRSEELRKDLEKKIAELEARSEARAKECHERINNSMTLAHAEEHFTRMERAIEGLAGNIQRSTDASEKRWESTNSRLDLLVNAFANRVSSAAGALG